MENIKLEELSEILNRINGWIENCDSKVSTILSGLGVFAGVLLATDYVSKFIEICRFMCEKITALTVLYLSITSLSICLLLYGVFLFTRVLFAKIDIHEFESRGVRKDSLIFFASIAQNTTLKKYREKLRKCSAEKMSDDIISQIYICSLICDKKFSLYKKGLICSIVGFCIFAVMLIIGVAFT